MDKYTKFIPYGILLCIIFLSLGYAAFSSKLTIAGITASVRPEKNIRVTAFYATNGENEGQSQWEEYSVNRIATDVVMPYQDSTVSYKVKVVNLGGISMSVRDIIGVPDNMEIEYNDYKLGETLCDSSKNEEPCRYGAQDEFIITIKYKDGMYDSNETYYELRLDLMFDCIYTIDYYQLLPDEYQELEYIESDGTQYIDTGVIPTNTLKTEIIYMDKTAEGSNYVLGSRTGNNGSVIHYGLAGKDNTSSIGAYYNSNLQTVFEKSRVVNGKYHVVLDIENDSKQGYRMHAILNDLNENNSEEVYSEYYEDGLKGTLPNIFVFAIRNENIHKGMRLYSLTFWDNGDLIANFVPCYRISDGVIGLYDMVNREFHTNDGTGTFISGTEVTNGYHVSKNQKFSYDILEALADNNYTRNLYTFAGWNTQMDKSGTGYVDKQEVLNLSISNGDKINLYAMWNPYSYTINYILNNLSISLEQDLNYDDSVNDSITLNEGVYTVVKSGMYTGLYLDSSNLKDGSTYLLRYKIKKIDGTLQNVGGHSTNGIEKSFTIDGVPSPTTYSQPRTNLSDDTNEHVIEYKFEYDEDIVVSTDNKNIYIQVNRLASNVPSVTVDIYDVEIYELYDYKTYYYGIPGTTISAPTKKGYVLKGWNTESDGSGTLYGVNQEIKNLSLINGGQVNLYSQWEIKSYAGSSITDMLEELAYPDNQASPYVASESGIDFAYSASDTNGKGIYIMSDTLNDTNPIYYYRGDIDNNNIIFGDYCWKMVRTTDTGGIKLIYNGLKSADGKCVNEGLDTELYYKEKFNTHTSLSAIGYNYTASSSPLSSKADSAVAVGTIFTSDATWDDTKQAYVLSGDQYLSTADLTTEKYENLKNHHYTCFSTTATECTTAYFVYMARDAGLYTVTLQNGIQPADVINSEYDGASTNTTMSSIRTKIETWYADKMDSLTPLLEDTVYCNDRSVYSKGGWEKNGPIYNDHESKLTFGGKGRTLFGNKPSVDCQYKSDRFTMDDQLGNGLLNYPVGLLTLDEANLAGVSWNDENETHYLNNGYVWWSMSPGFVSAGSTYMGVIYSLLDNVLPTYTTRNAGGIRPVISLKPGTIIKGGYGTPDSPFTIDETVYVPISKIYDSSNENEEMLHIGDFVNYDAGTWTQEEIDSIKVGLIESPVSANNSLELPDADYQFGGFEVGKSRNLTSAASQFESLGEVSYINDASTNKPIYGWRVYDIDETTGEVTLISAGNPEAFHQTNVSDAGYSTPYIFSGTIHSSWGEENAAKYLRRDWSVYVNKYQSATSAYILSKSDLEKWYSKHIGTAENLDLWTISNFQLIYSYPRLHNIIDNYSFWWLSSTRSAQGPHFVQGDDSRRLRGGNDVTLGIRVNVVLSPDARFSPKRVGTIELTSEHLDNYGGNQVYNVWDLKSFN